MYDTPAAIDTETLPVTRVIAALAEQTSFAVPAPREPEPQTVAVEQPVDLRSIYREFHDLAADTDATPDLPRGYAAG